jgi:Ca-activated chloride channel family protein
VQGTRPPADAVRLEELVNYFPYALPAPAGDAPIAIHTEVAAAPWRPAHRLVRVALQARPIDVERLPANNLVFLLDVSGSMQSEDKLPLVKRSLRLLVDQLRPQDRVALVVYAGSAGVVLPPTPGTEKARIAEAIERLEAGGSTAGGEGLRLAYRVAREHYARGGNNRVILATDGDFNVGVSSDAELERMVEQERASGVALTVLGFGTGNYQDAKMKKLAKRGDGNFAYIDRLDEARKALVEELGATLVTVARDVKLQVEFNPAVVRGYRLLGYEGRLLRDEDFADDAKDAGDVGAGHTVTALYEVVPVGTASPVTLRGSEPLRYGAGDEQAARRAPADELLHVALRYKRPGEATSRLLTAVVPARAPRTAGSDDLRFAASVAAFGMLLRESPFKGEADVQQVLTLARASLGADPGGYRAEFVRLVERWREIEPVVAGR